jgi:uncharacterized protein YlxP (DUF503 family)
MLRHAETGAGSGLGLKTAPAGPGLERCPEMAIGLLTLEIYIPESRSLKDKRQVLRSLKERLRGRFNVAVAELDHPDGLQRAQIGIVSISNNAGHLEQSLRTVLKDAEGILGRYLESFDLEML